MGRASRRKALRRYADSGYRDQRKARCAEVAALEKTARERLAAGTTEAPVVSSRTWRESEKRAGSKAGSSSSTRSPRAWLRGIRDRQRLEHRRELQARRGFHAQAQRDDRRARESRRREQIRAERRERAQREAG